MVATTYYVPALHTGTTYRHSAVPALFPIFISESARSPPQDEELPYASVDTVWGVHVDLGTCGDQGLYFCRGIWPRPFTATDLLLVQTSSKLAATYFPPSTAIKLHALT